LSLKVKNGVASVSRLPLQNPIFRFFWTLDSYVSTGVFEGFAALRRWGSALSSFLYRFRLSGFRRLIVDLLDDAATFGTVFAFALLAFALPPFSGTGDVWNKGREYAITFTDSDGNIIGRRGIRQDDAIPLDDIPSHVINAVLATEDARFYQHFGVDVIGTLRAIVQNARANDVVQGGSSITQQVAKNLFLSPERTIRRKVHEAFLALWIEARLSKDEILKLYLDRSYMGAGNYGIEAAAQYYFGKSVRDVTLAEAAMLAGLFKAPSKYAPHLSIDNARARANVVLYRMLDVGFISQGELIEARREPAQLVAHSNIDSPDWFLDKAYEDTLALIDQKGITGDFVIEARTTIDRNLQQAAQQAINDELETEGPPYHATQAAAVTMTPDGAIKAIVGGRDYEVSQFNRATDALRQPGSSFKPFVYLTALLHGFTPQSVVLDGPVTVGGWSPRNYNGKYGGRVTLTSALAHSYNSVPVKLSVETGRKAIIETAHAVGVQAELETWPPMVLGTSAMSLLDLTTGYATFAAGGIVARPYTVLEIRRPNGDVLYSRATNPEPKVRAVDEEKIAELNSMLHAVVTSGTGRRAFLGFTPQGGKTGTNQSYRDAWFIGFTAHNVTGVWFGNDDFTEMNKLTGGILPAATWKTIMLEAEKTETAAALPGIPLDDSYARYAAQEQPQLEFVPTDTGGAGSAGTPAAGTVAATTGTAAKAPNTNVAVVTAPSVSRPRPRQPALASANEDDVVVIKPRETSDPVIGVFRDMFGLFSNNDDEQPVKKKRRSSGILLLPDANTNGAGSGLKRLRVRDR
jgi:penicillin-binding protein 1A